MLSPLSNVSKQLKNLKRIFQRRRCMLCCESVFVMRQFTIWGRHRSIKNLAILSTLRPLSTEARALPHRMSFALTCRRHRVLSWARRQIRKMAVCLTIVPTEMTSLAPQATLLASQKASKKLPSTQVGTVSSLTSIYNRPWLHPKNSPMTRAIKVKVWMLR